MKNYLPLIALPKAKPFLLANLISKIPTATLALALILLITSKTGSYALAGGVSALLGLSQALVSPKISQWADRYGQARILLPGALMHTLFLGLLVVAVYNNSPSPLLMLLAVLTGVSMISMGPFVRARWVHMTEANGHLHAAFSLEAVLDEMFFVLGPSSVSLFAALVDPLLSVVLSASSAVLGALLLTRQKSTAPPVSERKKSKSVQVYRNAGVLFPAAALFFLGIIFGINNVAVPGFSQEQGREAISGVLLASIAVGSLLGALFYGARSWQNNVVTRYQYGFLFLLGGVTLNALSNNIFLLAGGLFAAGLFIAPLMIMASTIIERASERNALTEGLGLMSAAIGLGVALGASVGGFIIDSWGAQSAFLVGPACVSISFILVAMSRNKIANKIEGSSRSQAPSA